VSVKARYDAAHTLGVVLSVGNFIIGFVFHVEIHPGTFSKVYRCFWWHSTLSTRCITSSGYVLQPNIQEREFGHYAPSLEDLDPAKVRNWYNDMVRVGHDFGIYLPAYEDAITTTSFRNAT